MELNRRNLVKGTAGLGTLAVGGLVASPAHAHEGRGHGRGGPKLPNAPRTPADRLARDERYWRGVARHFRMDMPVINFENGYFGANPQNVRDTYAEKNRIIQEQNSWFLRNDYEKHITEVRARLAKAVGCSVDEIAITRGATEALQVMIGGYNKLKPGDAVAYADLDYDSMQYAMNWLKDRRGVDVITTAIPEPARYQNVIDHYTKLLSDNPRIKLLLLTHISHRTGLKAPIAEISRMAAERGVDTIVDAAHSWGHVDFDVKDLNSPFVGFNLHKWIGAPLGCGFLYIQKDRLGDIDRHFADEDFDADDVRSRIHTGTANSANCLSIPAALDFHHAVGAANKFARLQYLRDRWVQQVLDVPNLTILTPEDRRMYGALTSFRIDGNTTREQSVAITDYLTNEWGVFTVRRGGVTKGEVIRVTPALYNTPQDSDRLARALKAAAKRF